MNRPLRRVAVAVMVLFGLLLANANYVQVVQAHSLKNNPHNGRVLLNAYERKRGPILAGRAELAWSVPTGDRLKYLRRYAAPGRFAHVTGFFSLVYGATAIEREENSLLSGDDDRLFVRRIGDLFTGRAPEGGAVVLTLNPAMQAAADQALGAHRGAVVALNPRTGAILAMVSHPSYDPNTLTSHDPAAIRAAYQRLSGDPAAPLLDRAIAQTYPPGSLFKVVTVSAGLASGRYRPESQVPAPNRLTLPQTTRTLGNFGGETCGNGQTDTLVHAFQISCNTTFAAMGLALGADALRRQAEGFGFDAPLAVPMPVAQSRFPANPDRPQTAFSAIGQFDVRLTPLQAALLAAGIANGGSVMRPYLVQSLQAPDLATLGQAKPEELRRATSRTVADEVTTLMEAVVRSGTGTRAQIAGVPVAGKTGTAQNAPGKAPHAWFIGFAPANDPQVAVAVLVENGGSAGSEATGGRVAAPIARAVMMAGLAR